MMKIQTNYHHRPFRYNYEVPLDVLNNEFDWMLPDAHYRDKPATRAEWNELDDYGDGFFYYRGVWYHLSDFMVIPDGLSQTTWKDWHGYKPYSMLCCILIRVDENGETYQIATYQ